MADNPIKKLRDEMMTERPAKPLSKANRTLYLTEPMFSDFATHCRAHKRKPSEVIDRLIAIYMAELDDGREIDLAMPQTTSKPQQD